MVKYLRSRSAFGALALGLACATPQGVSAYEVRAGGFTINFDTTLKAGVQMRTQSPDCRRIGFTNGGCVPGVGPSSDDGNLNYDKWDFTAAPLSVLEEIEIKNGNYGFFGRVTAFYDPLLNNASHTRRTDLSDDAREVVGRDIKLLDAYAYGLFTIAGRPLDVRLGNQAFNWGESLFTQGGINQSNPIDVSRRRQPGSEIKEATLPTPAIRLAANLTDAISVETYYQFLWEETELDPVGTFFSTADIVGEGAEGLFTTNDPGNIGAAAYAPAIPPTYFAKGPTEEARNSGQWGVSAKYYEDDLSALLGLYYLRYHSKTPVLGAHAEYVNVFGPIFTGVPQYYFEQYVEDVDLYGASVSVPVGDAAVGFEVSYQPNFPTPLNLGTTLQNSANAATTATGPATLDGYVREKRWLVSLNSIYSIAPGTSFIGAVIGWAGADKADLIAEVAMTVFPSLDPTIDYQAPDFTNGVDKTSWGYRLSFAPQYSRVLGTNVSLRPSVAWQHDVNGNAPGGNGAPFVDDRRAITLGLSASYLSYEAGLSYTNYFGSGASNIVTDRDFISLDLSYSF
ncbi:DUF1302 domain-containing protein [Parvibaculum sp.]|uniref:DUF1302 domain-containing protein n=1 Tax=Parvibaculum sp. TaxID=2024848 RepID=UPI00391A294D